MEKVEKSIEGDQLPALRQEVLIVRVGAQNLDLGYSIYPVIMDEKKHFALTFMEISQSKHIQSDGPLNVVLNISSPMDSIWKN